MLTINYSSIITFENNVSYFINENSCINSKYDEQRHLSTIKMNDINDSINIYRLNQHMPTNSSWIEKCKKRVIRIFKQIFKSTTMTKKQDSMATMNSVHQQSTFIYDPEIDLREEHITLISKHLLTTLRESKIKHLSCNNLFLPCNHIRNIAQQCLIMSAEEPFGIMGAQIKIKLTLLSSNMKSTIVKYLPIIRINSKQKTIFEIEIDLHEDTKVFTLRRFLPDIKLFKQFKEKSSLYVSPRCLLVKNVFYKTAEPKRAIVDT
ncbi:unnamed protein product [Rotaria sp. Silwood2]|nr:unnamed protein product [Rotaria sp. Silwood2]CAF4539743.1 unnamed protein product [Rotaria sp. Silwood2]